MMNYVGLSVPNSVDVLCCGGCVFIFCLLILNRLMQSSPLLVSQAACTAQYGGSLASCTCSCLSLWSLNIQTLNSCLFEFRFFECKIVSFRVERKKQRLYNKYTKYIKTNKV